ncbi:META domain-containing protein [Chryseobacterium sp. GMJ5]|uniref:META domain-containing protein n=1 Tax=Chryseobacterium gilvum TaxID=2976534 RepID=A0ABT2VSV7_9FLAO|nr:META domain-containing protein [Chryseobacterium gilvum]MCU7613066.1 META domain-containing protein [Chryseobacterium gilvum]
MKKVIFTILCSAISFISVQAQTNILAKTTWKVEDIKQNGSAIFTRAKTIKFPSEQPTFNYIQFNEDKKYYSGSTCFQMVGTYSVYEDNQVEISEGTADMSSDCKEPKTFTGTYTFTIDKDRLELIPVKN